MSEAERAALQAALALIEHGFADYGEHILRGCAGRSGAAPLRLLKEAGTSRAVQVLREALRDDG